MSVPVTELCPHGLRKNQYNRPNAHDCEAYNPSGPLSSFLVGASWCAECALLLRAVEQIKRGWIDQQRDQQARITYEYETFSFQSFWGNSSWNVFGPAFVNLYDSYDGDRVSSFQMFRLPRGELLNLRLFHYFLAPFTT
jgi:hypothetical protein